MRSSADYNVVLWHLGCQACDVGSLELAVAVTQNGPWLVAGANARNDRGTIAAIDRMVDHLEARIGCGQAIGDLASAVAASVVDHDDFMPRGDLRQFELERRDYTLDIAFLVVAGQEDADPGQKG